MFTLRQILGVSGLTLALALAGCGQKGPLYLPPATTAAAPGALPAPASAPPAAAR
ncbi:LPS translocon maturation chaperone LptM [Aquabacterium sp. A08]|uniref:LPS translocon maturation chaperone LptM n=1 Tax=Aquabacterium sp. A08 TaxID=2718532 RepID=UPI001422BDC2|nr:lipoprotein [Aquabacterium sp. A08]NIC42457.1 cell envelope biogenesis protein OmpA [Aquabacterium sp. A08]NIC42496.1 cell envelope biogenesis protein OmpA [Aquabacterium sp. A08]